MDGILELPSFSCSHSCCDKRPGTQQTHADSSVGAECEGPCFLGVCPELKAGRMVPLALSLCDLEHSSPFSVSTHTQGCKKPQQGGGTPHPAPPQMSQAQQEAWGGVHWGTEWSGSGMWGRGRDASQTEGLEGLSGEFESVQPCGQSSPLPAALAGLCWEPTCPAAKRQCELALTLRFCHMQDYPPS